MSEESQLKDRIVQKAVQSVNKNKKFDQISLIAIAKELNVDFSEVTKLPRYGSYDLHDFTISPLTSHYCDICENENNNYRMKDSGVFQRNFGVFNVSGKKGNRQLNYSTYSSVGDKLWSYKINENDFEVSVKFIDRCKFLFRDFSGIKLTFNISKTISIGKVFRVS